MPLELQLYNLSRHQVLVPRLLPARSFYARLRGLMFRPALAPDAALWLVPCRALHTVGMRFPLDVVFLDRHLVVLATLWAVPPGRLGLYARGAHSAVEAGAGALEGRVEVGDSLRMSPSLPDSRHRPS